MQTMVNVFRLLDVEDNIMSVAVEITRKMVYGWMLYRWRLLNMRLPLVLVECIKRKIYSFSENYRITLQKV